MMPACLSYKYPDQETQKRPFSNNRRISRPQVGGWAINELCMTSKQPSSSEQGDEIIAHFHSHHH